MTNTMRMAASLVVALGLAAPTVLDAQAVARPGTASGGPTTSGSSGSSSSGSGGTSSGPEVSAPASSRTGAAADPAPRVPSRIPSTSASGRTGTAAARSAPPPAPGGTVGSGSSSSAEPRSTTTVGDAFSRYGSQAGINTGYTSVSGRSRGGQPITGTAGPRPIYGGDDMVSFPLYGPWGNWYPWYYSGFGWGVGFVGYNPWYYPATCWNWGYYGMWYSPSCYYWDPMWAGPSYAPSESSERARKEPEPGSIRIKANPSHARVYVDNALVGTVAEFNGLSGHLKLDRGSYMLELRADGYETVSKEVTVAPGKTQTVRLSLKKK